MLQQIVPEVYFGKSRRQLLMFTVIDSVVRRKNETPTKSLAGSSIEGAGARDLVIGEAGVALGTAACQMHHWNQRQQQ